MIDVPPPTVTRNPRRFDPSGASLEREQLLAVQHALRHLHPQHLRVFRLPLAVRAAHETEPSPLFGIDFAAFETAERLDELIDLRGFSKRQPRASCGLGIV